MADEEKRVGMGYGAGTLGYGPGLGTTADVLGTTDVTASPTYYGGYNPYFGYGFGFGHCCRFFPGFVAGHCVDQFFLQIICILKGECVKVLLAHSPAICGRLIQIEANYISVSVDGTVAYIPLADLVAIIPVR